jgi:hypothetical protein
MPLRIRRRVESAGCEHDLVGLVPLDLAVALDLYPGDAGSVEQQLVNPRTGEHREERRIHHGRRIGLPGAESLAIADVDLHLRDAIQGLAVVVGVLRDADLARGVDDRLLDRMQVVVHGDVEQAVGSAQIRGRAVVVLDRLEDRQHVVPAPAGIAERLPVVVVLGSAAHVDHRVEGVRPAEHLAARQVESPVGGVLLRHREVVPVVGAVPQLAEARRIVDGGIDILSPAGVDEPAGDHRTARATTDDNDVGSFVHEPRVARSALARTRGRAGSSLSDKGRSARDNRPERARRDAGMTAQSSPSAHVEEHPWSPRPPARSSSRSAARSS